MTEESFKMIDEIKVNRFLLEREPEYYHKLKELHEKEDSSFGSRTIYETSLGNIESCQMDTQEKTVMNNVVVPIDRNEKKGVKSSNRE